MEDNEKTKDQLIEELTELRQKVAELGASDTERKQAEETLVKLTHDLGERVKELNCLYGISRLIETPGISLEDIYQGAVDLIPPAWQYPDITCARAVIGNREFKTDNFRDAKWKQASDIAIHGEKVGVLEVCYLDEKPGSYEGPFLKEERYLIDAIAERLGRISERIEAERVLQERIFLEGLYQKTAKTILSTLDRDEILNRMNEYIVSAGAFRSLCISLPDYKANCVTVHTSARIRGKDGEITYETGDIGVSRALDSKDILAETVRTGEIQVVVEWDERFYERFPREHYKGQVAYFIPVKHNNTVVAVLATGSTIAEKEETLRRINSLGFLMDQFAIALDHARLYEEAQKEITKRKQAEDALQKDEQTLRDIFESTLSGYWDWNLVDNTEYLSPTFKRMFGYEDHEMENLPEAWQKIIFPEDLPGVFEVFDRHVKSRGLEPFYNEIRYRHRDGSTVWVFCAGRVIKWATDGTPARMVGCHVDITKRKQAEDALRESEERWQFALEGSSQGVWDWNVPTGEVFFSRRWKEMLGFEEDEISGSLEEWKKRVHPEGLAQCFADVQAHFDGKTSHYENTHKVLCKDGTYKWILDRGKVITRTADGQPLRMVGTHTDITKHKQAEETLRLQSAIVKNITEGICLIKASDSQIVYTNPKFMQMFGYDEDELVGQHVSIINAPTEEYPIETANKIIQVLADQGVWSGDVNNIKKDGTPFWCHANVSIFNHPAYGQVWLTIHMDITDRKRMEENLRRAHNLESLGLLAGGIAHDFNNVLTGVIGNIAILERLLDKDSTEYEIVCEAKTAADRTRGLTTQLLTFARGGGPVKEAASIEDLIKETVTLSLHGANTKPQYHLPDDLWLVNIDTGQIGQVIQNLVINADQAMPNGGTLKVSAVNTEVSDEDSLPLEPGSYVKVTVADQGIGMSEKVMGQIFDPYFSTKDKGHGLGLSITYSIVQRHGGYITVDSVPDEGTTFEFYLPATKKETVVAAEQEKEIAHGTGRILLMDDEETIHKTVGRALTMLGYDVEYACDGDETLRMYEASLGTASPYAAVIMDLTIPGGMGGKEAVGKLHDIHPEARVIVSSGYANDPIMERPDEYGFVGKINKPFDLKELADIVQKILAVPDAIETILLVDDDASVLKFTAALLEAMEHSVITAGDDSQALEIYQDRFQEIDRVILDYSLGRANGIEVYMKMKEINPEVQAILGTGYGTDDVTRQAIEAGMLGVVTKPYRAKQLAEALNP